MNNIDILEEKEKIKDKLFPITHINGYINLYEQKEARIYTSELSRWQSATKDSLNLIETLIAENKELKEEKEKLGKLYYEANENCIKYENRIKKAIDYIAIDDDILETCGMFDVNGIELLKILKGG